MCIRDRVLRVLLKDPDGQADRWHLLAWEDGAFTLTPQPVPDLAYLLMREHHNFPYDAPYMSSQLLLSREGDGCVLGLALVEGGTHSAGMGNLMVGLWDLESQPVSYTHLDVYKRQLPDLSTIC